MKFTKMHGLGNGYIFVDCFSERTPLNPHGLALEVSDPRRGIGSDGLILIEPSEVADAKMRIFSPLGEEVALCGNGVRCVAKYLFDNKLCTDTKLKIETGQGIQNAEVFANSGIAQLIKVDMGEPTLAAASIPTTLSGDAENGNRVVNAPMDIEGLEIRVNCVSVFEPHCVIFVGELGDELVHQLGPIVEAADVFPSATNVHFVDVHSKSNVTQRTWQRNAGESNFSVQGAVASCVAGVLTGRADRAVENKLQGGTVQLEWDEATNHVFLTGPAVEVFSGRWNGLS